MADALHEIAAAQAAHREPEKVECAQGADLERGEVFEAGAHGQERALEALAGQKDGCAEQQRGDGRDCSDHLELYSKKTGRLAAPRFPSQVNADQLN